MFQQGFILIPMAGFLYLIIIIIYIFELFTIWKSRNKTYISIVILQQI